MFQRPPTLKGVKLKDLLTLCSKTNGKKIEELAKTFHFEEFLEREVNKGFSGGEIKKANSYNCLCKILY